MFENLLESRPKRERTLGETALSVTFHLLLALGAIQASRRVAVAIDGPVFRVPDFVLPEPRRPVPPSSEPAVPRVVIAVDRSPTVFRTVLPPANFPVEIPPVNVTELFDARPFSGRDDEHGADGGVLGAPSSRLTDPLGAASFTLDQVDDPARFLGGPEPVYPEAMKLAGIAGMVRLRFVVGVDGRVEPATVRVVSSSHEAFEQSAIEGIRKMRFSPARMRGQTVRQLVEQNIRFRLD